MIRILTEDKNREDIIRLLKWRGMDATIIPCSGIYKGLSEPCLSIELAGILYPDAVSLAFEIKRMNGQETVLIQTIQTREEFI
jgi:hypothetical protein